VVPSFERRRPARRPLPEHLPRERIVYPALSACLCCGATTLRKIGGDVTETLELIPGRWKVIQHVREKFSCRACEAISQPPAHRTRSRAVARGQQRRRARAACHRDRAATGPSPAPMKAAGEPPPSTRS
jgi:transposase